MRLCAKQKFDASNATKPVVKSRQKVVIGHAGFEKYSAVLASGRTVPLQEGRAMRHVTISASRSYWREIAALLAAKVVALLLIYFLFFAAKTPVPPAPDHLFNQG